jgi:hypothetical protein
LARVVHPFPLIEEIVSMLNRFTPALVFGGLAMLVVVPFGGFASVEAASHTQSDDPACAFNERMALDTRASPLDSAQVETARGQLKLCYGAPALRGRVMLGGEAVPHGELWRLGANEPTVLHTPGPILLGDVRVPAGPVALYAIPGPTTWQIFVTASTDHWGNMISPEVRAQELGSFTVPALPQDPQVEQLHFHFEDRGADGSMALVMTWQDVRLEIPVRVP